jgi:hypothetical protein
MDSVMRDAVLGPSLLFLCKVFMSNDLVVDYLCKAFHLKGNHRKVFENNELAFYLSQNEESPDECRGFLLSVVKNSRLGITKMPSGSRCLATS